jgi:hypothetical protein
MCIANDGRPTMTIISTKPRAVRLVILVLIQWLLLATFLLPRYEHLQQRNQEGTIPVHNESVKVLYMVTSMAEFDDGNRDTLRGRDRYKETLIPVVLEAVHSMLNSGFQVDVYLVTHYELSPDRLALLQEQLPPSVGLQVWDDATPLGYAPDTNKDDDKRKIRPITRALSRQHRYIIKDKLLYYDLFVNFEDDMMIKGEHLDHYLAVTKEIERLKKAAPGRIPDDNPPNKLMDQYHGNLTKIQLARMVPGLIRVEVVEDRAAFERERGKTPMPFPQSSSTGTTNALPLINTKTCCQKTLGFWKQDTPEPTTDNVFLWETQTIVLGLRKMPTNASLLLDWVFLQKGVDQNWIPREKIIGEFWTGNTLPTTVDRPDPTLPQTINNQGGWIGTRDQIFAWHRAHCNGLFLPPYKDQEALKNNVEFWSGGLNLVGRNACQLQRIISMHPKGFSKHLIYHTSNNKQKRKDLVFTNVQAFWEQLYSVQLQAEHQIPEKQR